MGVHIATYTSQLELYVALYNASRAMRSRSDWDMGVGAGVGTAEGIGEGAAVGAQSSIDQYWVRFSISFGYTQLN